MICRNCCNTMRSVVRCDGKNTVRFFRCRGCFSETKHTPLIFDTSKTDNNKEAKRGVSK